MQCIDGGFQCQCCTCKNSWQVGKLLLFGPGNEANIHYTPQNKACPTFFIANGRSCIHWCTLYYMCWCKQCIAKAERDESETNTSNICWYCILRTCIWQEVLLGQEYLYNYGVSMFYSPTFRVKVWFCKTKHYSWKYTQLSSSSHSCLSSSPIGVLLATLVLYSEKFSQAFSFTF